MGQSHPRRLLRRITSTADPVSNCLRQASGLTDLIQGLTLAFHGCVYIRAYIATGGAIQLTLTFAPSAPAAPAAPPQPLVTSPRPQPKTSPSAAAPGSVRVARPSPGRRGRT